MHSSPIFYYLATERSEEFKQAKLNEKRKLKKKWFFSKTQFAGDKYLWEYLTENCSEKFAFPYSGFLIADYFLSYLLLDKEYFRTLDDHFMTISYEKSQELLTFLEANPVDQAKLGDFLLVELSLPKVELETVIGYCLKAHEEMKKLLRGIESNHFGIFQISHQV